MKSAKLKKYGLSNERVASIFGYKNLRSFYSSRTRVGLIASLEEVIEIVEKEMIRKLGE